MSDGHPITQARSAKNYRYGARRPIQGLAEVEEQMRLAARYKNALIAQERERRQQVAAALTRYFPEINDLEASLAQVNEELESLHAEIARKNAAAKRKSGTREDRERVAFIKASRCELAVRLREAKRAAYDIPKHVTEARRRVRDLKQQHNVRDRKLAEIPEGAEALRRLEQVEREWLESNRFAAELRRIDQADAEERKRLRAQSGLYWGSYLAIEDDLTDIRSGAPPEFVAWDGRVADGKMLIPGEGRIAVQLQGGLSWPDALACTDNRLRIEIVTRGRPKRGVEYANVWMRIGSDGRAPVWAVVPVKLHRQPPDDARIKWVYLHRGRVGVREVWLATFSIESSQWGSDDAAEGGTVAVELGWRRFPGVGVRVAVWIGDDGRSGELRIPERVIDRDRWEHDCRALCSLMFNEARDALASALDGLVKPEWLTAETASLRQWRSQLRLAALYRRWSESRFDGDDAAYAVLDRWYPLWRRRFTEASDLSDWLTQWRIDFYRKFAVELRRWYRTAIVEDIDWSDLARLPEPQEDSDDAIRRYRRLASVGKLKQICREGFPACVLVDAADTTVTCHRCGGAMEPPGEKLYVRCEQCNEEFDVDVNAAHNLLHRNALASSSG